MKYFIVCVAFIMAILPQSLLAGTPKVGDPAPDFSLSSVKGDKVSLRSLKGKVILMGMFHICVPCMNQAMEFNKVKEAFGEDKLAIIGINTSGDSGKKVSAYLDRFPEKVTFPYLLDPKFVVDSHYVQRDMPTILIIDQEGVIRARAPGVGADQIIPFIKKLL